MGYAFGIAAMLAAMALTDAMGEGLVSFFINLAVMVAIGMVGSFASVHLDD